MADIQPLWVQETFEVPSMSERVAATHSCAQRKHCSTAHPPPSSPYGSVHLHFARDVHASVTASDIEKEGSCPTACATFPILVGRDRSVRNWSIYQDRSPRWVGPHVPNTSQWSPRRSGAVFQNHARSPKTRSVETFQQCHKIRQERSLGGRGQQRDQWHQSLFRPLRNNWETLATCPGVIVQCPAAHKRMTGKYFIDVFGASDECDKSFGSAWPCARREFWSQV